MNNALQDSIHELSEVIKKENSENKPADSNIADPRRSWRLLKKKCPRDSIVSNGNYVTKPASDGYVLFPNAIHISPQEDGLIRTTNTTHIFNNNGRNDKKRSQGAIKKEKIPELFSAILKLVKGLYPSLAPRSLVVLHSQPGCAAQKPHADYDPRDLIGLADDKVPRGMLIAMDDGTSLDIWPGSHVVTGNPIKKVNISLSRGDVVVFRGDTIHAGAAYKKENTRVHVYLDNPNIYRPRNETWPIQKLAVQNRIIE